MFYSYLSFDLNTSFRVEHVRILNDICTSLGSSHDQCCEKINVKLLDSEGLNSLGEVQSNYNFDFKLFVSNVLYR